MDKILEILKINWVHQLIGVCFFVLGVLLGALAVSIIWKKFRLKEKSAIKNPKDVSYLTQNAISAFDNGKTTLGTEKISYICESLTYLLDKIPQEYGNTKAYEVLKKESFKLKDKEVLLSNLSMHLDFTIYELLRFVNCFAEQMRGEVYSLINSKAGKTVWGVGKLFLKNKMQEEDRGKALDEMTVGALVNTVVALLNKSEEKPESKLKAFFQPLIKGAQNVALSIGNTVADVYIREIIEIFANELNKLYSGQLKSIVVKDVSASFLEEGV